MFAVAGMPGAWNLAHATTTSVVSVNSTTPEDGALDPPASPDVALRDLASLFLKLGLTAFGGPSAHIALMQQEVVDRRNWISRQEFVDLLGASNLIPGPSSTELAIHIGYRLAGWRGLLLAGICFIFPAYLLVMAIAAAYVRYGRLPQVEGVLYGVKPVVIAIVMQAIWNLGRTAWKSRLLAAAGGFAIVAAVCAVNPLAILLGGGAIAGVGTKSPPGQARSLKPLALMLGLISVLVAIPYVAGNLPGGTTVGTKSLFLLFLKLGSIVYGSGYVLLAFIRTDLVLRLHWLNSAQLLDAVAIGQATPGPVFTTATFIGYLLWGPTGAAAATLGIFLPAFLFVAVSGPLIPRMRKSASTAAFLDGVNAASVALMVSVCWELGRAAIVDPATLILAASSAIAIVRFRVNSLWLVLGGAVVGLLISILKMHA